MVFLRKIYESMLKEFLKLPSEIPSHDILEYISVENEFDMKKALAV